ncbi:MAG: hypothetical protein ACLQVL_32840 [Terriglobia bacterium]
MSSWLQTILVLGWVILIARVMHSESLVKDRQCGIAQPYEWKKLLAAKLLFICAFINGTLLIADVFLLRSAGFHDATSWMPRLFWMQVALAGFLLLPIVALASVTANVGQMTLAVIGGGLFLLGTAILVVQYRPDESICHSTDWALGITVIVACLITVLRQYSGRGAGRSRAPLIVAAMLLFGLGVGSPYRTIVSHEYPLPHRGERPPLQLALEASKLPFAETDLGERDDVEIEIPMGVSAMARSSFVRVEGKMITIDTADGPTWDSGWRTDSQVLFANQEHLNESFEVKRKLYEKIKGTNVRVHISLALTLWHEKNPTRVFATGDDFEVPGVGQCSVERGSPTSIHCRFAVRSPRLVVVETDPSESTCPGLSGLPFPATTIARGWGGRSADTDPPLLVSPVGTFNLRLWAWFGVTDTRYSPRVCAGTPLSFNVPDFVRPTRVELNLGGLRLADYRIDSSYRFRSGTP